MFAVPGWAVSAEALVSATPKDIPASSRADTAPLDSRSTSKKRRRDEPGPLSESRVTSEDLHTLWNKEFGNGRSVKQKASRVRKKKGQPKPTGGNSLHEDQAMQEVDRKDDSNARHYSGSKDTSERQMHQIHQNAEKRHKKKPRATSDSKKGVGKIIENPETNARADFVPHSEHDKVQEHSELMLQNTKAQQALQKLQELPPTTSSTLTPLQAKMRDKLTSARFRHLNQTLYTSPSSASLDLFTTSPDLFAEYHAGFAQQVKDSWPENPVDGYIHDIKARAKVNFKMGKQDSVGDVVPLARRKTGSCTIADLGCGDAPLARAFQTTLKALNLQFHNFDLHTPNSFVTKADIANLPLRHGEADIVVFCLSLMGTNWISFIEEGWRVLRGDGKGELWVAEVKSRFGRVGRGKVVENSFGKRRKPQKLKTQQPKGASLAEDEIEAIAEDEGTTPQDETDVSAFVNVVERRGFALQPESVNKHNKMFVSMIFNKSGIPAAGKYQGLKWNGWEYEKSAGSSGRKKFVEMDNEGDGHPSPEEEAKVLKPCVYKKR